MTPPTVVDPYKVRHALALVDDADGDAHWVFYCRQWMHAGDDNSVSWIDALVTCLFCLRDE